MFLEKEIQNRIIKGNILDVLKQFPDECIDLVITSPPYYGLRSYLPKEHPDKKKEIGLEDTFEQYINNLMEIFREIKRALKKTGSFYLNIGDTFSGIMGGYGATQKSKTGIQDISDGIYAVNVKKLLSAKDSGVPRKSFFGIPERFMLKMIDEGWICRGKIIWWKRNHMPGSQKDRLTCSWEPIYHFVKNNKGSDWYVYGNEPSIEKFPEKYKIWLSIPQKYRIGCWHKDKIPKELLPGFLNLDYYYDLDIVREPHKFISLQGYKRAVEYGSVSAPDSKMVELKKKGGDAPQQAPKSFQAVIEGQKMSIPPKDDGICAVPKNIKKKFEEMDKKELDLFGSPRAREERLKRKGKYKPGEELVEDKHHGSSHHGRAGFENRRNKTADESSFKTGGMRQAPEPGEEGAFNVKGKNPADVVIAERIEANIEHFKERFGGGGNYLYGGIDSEEAKHTNISGKNPGDMFDVTTAGFGGSHFAVFPVNLLIRPILSSSPINGVVLDPFMGSGTTGLVAKVLKRKYIGIDINEKYMKMAEDRIKSLEEQERVMIKFKERYPEIYEKFIGQKKLF